VAVIAVDGGGTVKAAGPKPVGMAFDTLALTVDERGVATLRLDHEPVNAITQSMRFELAEAIDELRADPVRVAVITGANDLFSVGADVALFEEAAEWTTAEFRANSRVLGRVFDGLETLEKPVLAAITGSCVGGGLELALACDIRIAAPDARLGFPEHTIGLLPGLGGCSRFVKLVGPGVAKDLIFRGKLVDGQRAQQLGFVERVTTDPETAAVDYAETLLDQPPQALGLAKRVVNAARDTDLRTAGLLESLAQGTLLETADHAEGLRAFREDRDPEFTGR
jgi:enoyl-CoA hydratase/carnithine racemase